MTTRLLCCYAALLATSLVLAACAGGGTPSGGTKTISSRTFGHYQTYLNDIGNSNPGAFAISEDGGSAFYFYCQDVRCASGGTYKQGALQRCRTMTKQECYVFAYRRDILVDYKVAN